MSFSSKWLTASTIWKGNWSKIQNANWGPTLRIETWERNQTFPAESWSHQVWGGGSQGCDLLTFWSTRFCSAALQVNKKHSSAKDRYLNFDSSVQSGCCHFSTPQLLMSRVVELRGLVSMSEVKLVSWSTLMKTTSGQTSARVNWTWVPLVFDSFEWMALLSPSSFKRKIRLVSFLSVALSFLINSLTTIP